MVLTLKKEAYLNNPLISINSLKLYYKLLFPKHLEISYKTLTILYKTESKFTSYPIRLNLNFISRYY